MQHANESLNLSAPCRCASYTPPRREGIRVDVVSNERVNYRVLGIRNKLNASSK